MSKRLARRSAGSHVLARAQRLSDETLAVEKQCSAAVGRVLAARVGVATEAFGAGWKRSKDDPKALIRDARMMARITEAHGRVLKQAQPLIEDATRQVLGMAVESIGEELRWCEKTLAQRYGGITDEALARVQMSIEDGGWMDARLTAIGQAVPRAGVTFEREAKRQVQFSGQYGDTQAAARGRLFSQIPNRLLGNSGLGIWWRTAYDLDAVITEASITVQSQVRTAAMAAFNEAGASR